MAKTKQNPRTWMVGEVNNPKGLNQYTGHGAIQKPIAIQRPVNKLNAASIADYMRAKGVDVRKYEPPKTKATRANVAHSLNSEAITLKDNAYRLRGAASFHLNNRDKRSKVKRTWDAVDQTVKGAAIGAAGGALLASGVRGAGKLAINTQAQLPKTAMGPVARNAIMGGVIGGVIGGRRDGSQGAIPGAVYTSAIYAGVTAGGMALARKVSPLATAVGGAIVGGTIGGYLGYKADRLEERTNPKSSDKELKARTAAVRAQTAELRKRTAEFRAHNTLKPIKR